MKKRQQSGLLVIVVDPEMQLTNWHAIAREGWAAVDIHIAADADPEDHQEAEQGRRTLDHLGVPLIAVTVDEGGIDVAHLTDCRRWWGVSAERVEVRVPEWDVERIQERLAEVGLAAAIVALLPPLRSGVLVIAVDGLTDWETIASDGWRCVDIRHSGSAWAIVTDEAERGRGLMEDGGVPFVTITAEEDGFDAAEFGTCLEGWGVEPDEKVEIWAHHDDVSDITQSLSTHGLGSVRVLPLREPAKPHVASTTLLAVAADALFTTEVTPPPSIVESLVAHGAGGWVEPVDGLHALADWRQRMARLTDAVDARLTLVIADGSDIAERALPALRSAVTSAESGTATVRDDWGPSELAAAIAYAIKRRLEWVPERVVIVLRDDAAFEDELRRAWLGTDGVTEDLVIVRVDGWAGLIERDIVAASGNTETAEELAILESRDFTEPL